MEQFRKAKRVADIDWATWRAVERATLVFVTRKVRRKREVLLIRKKRGLGAGKINGPGGKLDPGESARQCAARETQEELRIEVSDLELMAEHRFQFQNGHSIHVLVYTTERFSGTPTETDEAVPLWTDTREVPWSEMWADDELWLPYLFEGRTVRAEWIFDGEAMCDGVIEVAVALDEDALADGYCDSHAENANQP